MMGVVLALSGTLCTDDGLYVSALRYVLHELVAEHAVVLDERELDALVERLAPTLEGSPAGLDHVASLLRYGTMSSLTLAARVRMAAVERIPRHCHVFADVGPTLQALRELNVPLAVVSEGWSGIDHAKARLATFDGRVFSAEDAPGGDSRSLSAFAAITAKLHLSADRLWFVGADPRRDIAPARAAGLQTVWLDRDGRSYPAGVAAPDHTIRRLDELLDLIGEPYTKSALTLREILRSALRFRLGHVIPADPLQHEE